MKRVVAALLLCVSLSCDAVTTKNILESIYRKLNRVDSDVDAVLGKVSNIQSNTIQILFKICNVPTVMDEVDSDLDVLISKLDVVTSQVDLLVECSPSVISEPTTVTQPGVYCVANTIAGAIAINASNVSLDLAKNRVTGGISVAAGSNQVAIKNGTVEAGAATDAIVVNAGASNITIEGVTAKDGTRGINFETVSGGVILDSVVTGNTTGLELDNSHKITVKNCVADCNTSNGFSLISSTTNCFENCKALSTGQGNTATSSNNVFGFVSDDGYGNIFENCIANGTQALASTDYDSIVAGFALRGTEGCSKIINSEAANGTTSENGLTVPYGILVEKEIITGDLEITTTAPTISTYYEPDWSPDGKFLVVGRGSSESGFEQYSFDRNSQELTLLQTVDNGVEVHTVRWAPSGNFIAIGGDAFEGSELRIYRYDNLNNNFTQVAVPNSSPGVTVEQVSWSYDGRFLAVVARTDFIWVYEFDSVQSTLTLRDMKSNATLGNATSVDWSSDGGYLAATGFSGLEVYSFDRASKLLTLIDSHTAPPTDLLGPFGIAWSPDNKFLAVVFIPNTDPLIQVFAFDGATIELFAQGESLADGTGVSNPKSRSIRWTKDGRYIGAALFGQTAGDELYLAFYDLDRTAATLTRVSQFVLPGIVGCNGYLSLSPDDSYAAFTTLRTGGPLYISKIFNEPSKNIIKDNMVYCNSGNQCPGGIGISGSSIQNLIIGNTAYNNPQNYAFAANVFNPLFGQAPTDLQNISVDGCDPICSPADIALIIKQSLYKACTPLPSQLDALSESVMDAVDSLQDTSTKVDTLFLCAPTPFAEGAPITQSGIYCLKEDAVLETITISASDVVLDLNGYRATFGILISPNLNNVTIKNGVVESGGMASVIFASAGCSNIKLQDVVAKDGLLGIHFEGVTGGLIDHCEMTSNTTGLELDHSHKITVKDCVASCNSRAGFDLISSTTCCLQDCKALSTGEGNTDGFDTTVIGFVSADGHANIFERCIANATQALSTTDSDSLVAGFALRGDEGCSKIIECESANAITSPDGLTVPYGIKLDYTYTDFEITVTGYFGTDTVHNYTWSPDGKYVAAILSNPTTGTGDSVQIVAFDRNQSSLTAVAGALGSNTIGFLAGISWHPSGIYLAVVGSGITGGTGDALQVLKFDPIHQTLTPVFGIAADRGDLKWSPDGRFLLFGSQSNEDVFLYAFDAVAESLTLVDSFATGNLRTIDWAPDSKKILVLERVSSFDNDLYIFTVSAAGLTQLSVTNLTINEASGSCWSHSGKYIAVTYSDEPTLQVYVFDDQNGTIDLLVSEARGGTDCSWAPDDAHLLVQLEDSFQVNKFNPSDRTLTQLSSQSDAEFAIFSPDGAHVMTKDAGGLNALIIYDAYQFVSKNVIKDNTVYCNSGGSCPQGVGISGSSIQNMIIGNTSYSNPIPSSTGPIVGSNYQFVTNVFNQLFGQAPSAIQNISLDGCDPICQPEDINLTLKQALYKVCSSIPSQIETIQSTLDGVETKIDALFACNPTPYVDGTSIDTAGSYCLQGDVTSMGIPITVSDVYLDLNNYRVTKGILISGDISNVTVRNGVVEALNPMEDGILVDPGATDIVLQDLVVKNGQVGINCENVNNAVIERCEMTLNTTGLELDGCANITVNNCVASCNTHAGFDLLSSTTCCFENCKALSTGEGNDDQANTTVFGFVSVDGYANIFERCIANSTQALSVTDSSSLVAGFALRGSEGCSKIIDSEAANATANADGFTVPHGILLEARALDLSESITGAFGSTPAEINVVRWSDDGKYIAAGGEDITAGTGDNFQVLSFDPVSNALVPVAGVSGIGDNIYAIDWSPCGNYLAVGGMSLSMSNKLHIYRFDRVTHTLTFVAAALGSVGTVRAVEWSHDGRFLAVGRLITAVGNENELILFGFDKVSGMLTLLDIAVPYVAAVQSISSVSWSPDDAFLAAGRRTVIAATPLLFIFSVDKTLGSLTEELTAFPGSGSTYNIDSVAWSYDGKYLAILIDRDTQPFLQVLSYDRAGNSLTTVATALGIGSTGNNFGEVSWSGDNRYIAVCGTEITGGTGNELQLFAFDPSDESLTALAGHFASSGNPLSVAWSPDGTYLAVGGIALGEDDFKLFEALQFSSKNVIKDNTVYCNSGGSCPQGVGISGSSLQNLIIGNTAYSNPIPVGVNEPIVSSNYHFVTNVFNELFGSVPSDLQNKSLDGCAPICQKEDPVAVACQNQALLLSAIDLLLGHL